MTERLVQIKKILQAQKRVTVGELSDHFQVSRVTIRHDLTLLEQERFARRIHGGAILLQTAKEELQPDYPDDPLLERIAHKACSFINEGDFILLGPGQTCLTLARHLTSFSDLCVFTNNLAAVDILVQNGIRVYLMNGEVRYGTSHLLQTDPAGLKIPAEYLYAMKCFSTVSGIDLQAGLTVPYRYTAETIARLQESAKAWFLLADHTKYDQISVYAAGTTRNVTHLITDSIPQKYQTYFQRIGTQIHLA